MELMELSPSPNVISEVARLDAVSDSMLLKLATNSFRALSLARLGSERSLLLLMFSRPRAIASPISLFNTHNLVMLL
jgi:hypothetical protein